MFPLLCTLQLLADLDSLEKAVDSAQGNVTEIAGMVPMVQQQFEDNLEQLEKTQENAVYAHIESQTAQKVGVFKVFKMLTKLS